MEHFYKDAILEAVDRCEDPGLLDLVLKLLLDSTGAPRPSNMIALEVKTDADYSRNTRQHRTVPIQICRSTSYSDPVHPKMGNRGEQLPGVCGGADRLQSAA